MALGRIAPNSPAARSAVTDLIRGLDKNDPSVQLLAIQTLGYFGRDAADAVPRLQALRADRRTFLSDAVRKSLAAIEAASAEQARGDGAASPPAR